MVLGMQTSSPRASFTPTIIVEALPYLPMWKHGTIVEGREDLPSPPPSPALAEGDGKRVLWDTHG